MRFRIYKRNTGTLVFLTDDPHKAASEFVNVARTEADKLPQPHSTEYEVIEIEAKDGLQPAMALAFIIRTDDPDYPQFLAVMTGMEMKVWLAVGPPPITDNVTPFRRK